MYVCVCGQMFVYVCVAEGGMEEERPKGRRRERGRGEEAELESRE